MEEHLNAGDYAALKALYESTGGANWYNHSGWADWDFGSETPPPAYLVRSWHGVKVIGNRVTYLDLDWNHLTGSIPSELGNMEYLENLHLANNKLTGSIPLELGSAIRSSLTWATTER